MKKSSLKLSQLFSDNVQWYDEVENDLAKLDGSLIKQVCKAINKVAENPSSYNEGGLGKPLRNANETKLSGLNKIKLKKIGIRVVYKTVMSGKGMSIIIVSARADSHVYKEAEKRIKKYM